MKLISLPQTCPECDMFMTFGFDKGEWYYCCGCGFEGEHQPITDDLFLQIEYDHCIWRGSWKKFMALPNGELPPCKVGGTTEEWVRRILKKELEENDQLRKEFDESFVKNEETPVSFNSKAYFARRDEPVSDLTLLFKKPRKRRSDYGKKRKKQ